MTSAPDALPGKAVDGQPPTPQQQVCDEVAVLSAALGELQQFIDAQASARAGQMGSPPESDRRAASMRLMALKQQVVAVSRRLHEAAQSWMSLPGESSNADALSAETLAQKGNQLLGLSGPGLVDDMRHMKAAIESLSQRLA